MTFDWTISLGSVLTLVGFIASIIVAYYTMQRDTDKRFSDLAATVSKSFSDLDLRLAQLFEGDIRELRLRVATLEESTVVLRKELIDRAHKLAGDLQSMTMKVDRLERPTNTPVVIVPDRRS